MFTIFLTVASISCGDKYLPRLLKRMMWCIDLAVSLYLDCFYNYQLRSNCLLVNTINYYIHTISTGSHSVRKIFPGNRQNVLSLLRTGLGQTYTRTHANRIDKRVGYYQHRLMSSVTILFMLASSTTANFNLSCGGDL